MRKIHYNVVRFRDTLALDEAEIWRVVINQSVGRYYVLHDPQKLSDKYITAWSNFGIDIRHITAV